MDCLYTRDLLNEVFSRLTDYGDLIVCSSVCKAWRNTIEHVSPACLIIPGGRYQMTSTWPAMQWLQCKHKQDHFSKLRSLKIELWSAFEGVCETDEVSHFGQSVMLLAGLWQLQHCHLRGAIDVAIAAHILPSCLKTLYLRPDRSHMPRALELSIFQRFAALQSLVLDICNEQFWRSLPQPSSEAVYKLDVGFPSLTHLYLGVWRLQFPQHCSLTACLPNVCHLVAHVDIVDAAKLLALTSINYLGLVFSNTDFLHARAHAHVLTVPKHSQLMKLETYEPETCMISVDVQKPGLELRCSKIYGINASIHHVGSDKYKSVLNFPELTEME